MLPLRQFFTDHFEPLFLRGRSLRTRQLYLTTLRNFAIYLEREAGSPISPTIASAAFCRGSGSVPARRTARTRSETICSQSGDSPRVRNSSITGRM